MKIAKISSFLLLLTTLYSSGMQRPADVQSKIDAIKLKYQLPMNKVSACLIQNEPNAGLACFVAGYQTFYITPTAQVASFDNDLKELFSHLNVKQITIENDSILYTPQGQRNALLFAKLKLNDSLARLYAANAPVLQNNRYLIRSLLGYNNQDITNSYITESFNNWYTTNFKEKPLDALKKQQTFNDYEKNMWKTTNDYTAYLQDQLNANEWLQEQNNRNTERLEQEITSLKDQLHKKTSRIERLKTWLGVNKSESAKELNWTKWWN
jgi:hypothetical protein